jgi:hypothetical protein
MGILGLGLLVACRSGCSSVPPTAQEVTTQPPEALPVTQAAPDLLHPTPFPTQVPLFQPGANFSTYRHPSPGVNLGSHTGTSAYLRPPANPVNYGYTHCNANSYADASSYPYRNTYTRADIYSFASQYRRRELGVLLRQRLLPPPQFRHNKQ